MKILVTGSEGNVGRALVKHLKGKGHEVVRLDFMYINAVKEGDYFSWDVAIPMKPFSFPEDIDVIYHLAAVVGRELCEDHLCEALYTNVVGTSNVIQLCKALDAKLINFSTSDIYGDTGKGYGYDYDIVIPMPVNHYGLSKWLAERVVYHEVTYSSLEAIVVRPFMLYSEYESADNYKSALIRFADSLWRNERITVYKDTYRSWLHLDDAVVVFEKLLGYMKSDDVMGAALDIGHPESVSALELARMLLAAMGKTSREQELVEVKELPAGIARYKTPNLTEQELCLDFKPKISIEEGIDRIVKKLKERSENG